MAQVKIGVAHTKYIKRLVVCLSTNSAIMINFNFYNY